MSEADRKGFAAPSFSRKWAVDNVSARVSPETRISGGCWENLRFSGGIIPEPCSPSPRYVVETRIVLGATQFGWVLDPACFGSRGIAEV
jgi:hypothetical protein